MGSPHRPANVSSGLVLDTHDLGRSPGALREVRTTAPAPADVGIAVIGVPPGSPIDLDLRLESVGEGVLVTGTAVVRLSGECVRCLVGISESMEVDVQELFTYEASDATEEEAGRLEGELLDLEPVLRDQVVLDLPFRPLCREDCRGLCPQCGTNLNVHPDHSHAEGVDPRWSRLQAYGTDEAHRGRSSRVPDPDDPDPDDKE